MKDELDELLTKALARTDVPPDFTAQVMARVNERKSLRWTSWIALAAASVLLIAGWSGLLHYRARQNERQLVFALQLASEKIAAIDQRLRRSAAVISIRKEDLERGDRE